MDKEIIRLRKSLLVRILLIVLGVGIISFGFFSRPQTTYASPICGNNFTEPGEVCDGDDLNGYTCSSVVAGFNGGTLSCKPDCSGYEASLCERGGTIEAQSCSQQDVQAAINQAQDGDTVIVPEGNCIWTTPATRTPSVEVNNKSIVIKGAGIDQTIIVDNTGTAHRETPFDINGVGGKPFRITGFTFTGNCSSKGVINFHGTRNWHVDHNKFDCLGGRGLWVGADSYGVVDHCSFINTDQGVASFGSGDESWTWPLSLGTANAVYIEDNTFSYSTPPDGAIDAYGGARYVFRHNTVIGTSAGHHGLDSGNYRSTHSYEIYENSFFVAEHYWSAMHFRGGTGVVFNNILTGGYRELIKVANYRTCCINGSTSCSNWGRCDGSNPIDGNQDSSGYPCLDQVGRTSDTDGDGIQELEPLYEWNNTINGENVDVSISDHGCDNPSIYDHIQEGRDYFNDTPRPGYVPYVYPHPIIQLDVLPLTADLNNDGNIDVLDVQLCANVILGIERNPEIITRADVNKDSKVDVADELEIIKIILGK